MKVICFIRFAIMVILAMFDNVVRAQRHTKPAEDIGVLQRVTVLLD